MDNDPQMRRIHATTRAMADQSWRALENENRLYDLLRIGMVKESWEVSLEDWAFIKKVLALVAYEVSQRALAAREEGK